MTRNVCSIFVLSFVVCGCGEGSESLAPSSTSLPSGFSDPSNSPPQVGGDITVSLPENVIAGPLNLDPPTDSDGDFLTLIVRNAPTSGRLRKGSGASVSVGYNIGINDNIFGHIGLNFTPDRDTNDDNSNFGYFSYSVSDGTATAIRTIIISITPAYPPK